MNDRAASSYGTSMHHAVLQRLIAVGVVIAASSAFFDYVPEVMELRKGDSYLFWAASALHDDPTALLVVTRLTQFFGLLIALGWTNRVCGGALLFSFAAIYNVYWTATEYPVQWIYYLAPLLIFVMFPSTPGLRFWRRVPRRSDTSTGTPSSVRVHEARMAITTVRVWFAVIYASAFVSKAIPPSNLVDYVQGGRIQRLVHGRYLDSPLFHYGLEPLFDYSQPSGWFSLLAALGLIIELSAVLILVPRLVRTNLLVVAAILGMHAALFLVGVAGFFLTALVLAVSVLPSSIFARGWPMRGRAPLSAQHRAADPSPVAAGPPRADVQVAIDRAEDGGDG